MLSPPMCYAHGFSWRAGSVQSICLGILGSLLGLHLDPCLASRVIFCPYLHPFSVFRAWPKARGVLSAVMLWQSCSCVRSWGLPQAPCPTFSCASGPFWERGGFEWVWIFKLMNVCELKGFVSCFLVLHLLSWLSWRQQNPRVGPQGTCCCIPLPLPHSICFILVLLGGNISAGLNPKQWQSRAL